MAARAVVVGLAEASEGIGPQGQALTPVITSARAGCVGLSGGSVRMPEGGVSLVHQHARSEIIVAVLAGRAATVVWVDGQPQALIHSGEQMCYVPAGVPHCAVNLSLTEPVRALEFRTDPAFNDDVVLMPELQDQLPALVERLRAEHAHSLLASGR